MVQNNHNRTNLFVVMSVHAMHWVTVKFKDQVTDQVQRKHYVRYW